MLLCHINSFVLFLLEALSMWIASESVYPSKNGIRFAHTLRKDDAKAQVTCQKHSPEMMILNQHPIVLKIQLYHYDMLDAGSSYRVEKDQIKMSLLEVKTSYRNSFS